MPTKHELLPDDIRKGLEILPKEVSGAEVPGLHALWLFGSFAREETTPISDVDLAYLPARALQRPALRQLRDELYAVISGALHTDEFSLLNLRQVPAFLAWRVLDEGAQLLCNDPQSVDAFAEEVYCTAPDIYWLRKSGNEDFLEMLVMQNAQVNRERVIENLRRISENVGRLKPKTQLSLGEYLEDEMGQAFVERLLEKSIESCTTIGNHIIARLGLRAPQDYDDVFRVMSEHKVLPQELAERMMDLSKLRHILVHKYWEIDHRRIHASLPDRLKTLEAFERRIAEWLQESENGANSRS